MYFGAIADDVTGGTDLGSVIRQRGFSVLQTFGIPRVTLPPSDAVVVSLKSRTAPVNAATTASVAAARFLRDCGAKHLYFKYCSTFDSTDEGNIGPVIESLIHLTGVSFTVACPAYPRLQRTVYHGHLFVGDQLLSDSSMRFHPLTPMTDANLLRVLGRQCGLSIGLVPLENVDAGAVAISRKFETLQAEGRRIAIADAVFDRHIETLGLACARLPLVTGGAALGGACASAKRQAVRGNNAPKAEYLPVRQGPVAILSGSCSSATLQQVRQVTDMLYARALDPMSLAHDDRILSSVVDWACDRSRHGNLLLYFTAASEAVGEAHRILGRERAAAVVDHAFGRIAIALAEAGIRTFVIAGGETSGAVLDAVGIRVLAFGDDIDPGVPWTCSVDPPGFTFALKSGNFGSRDFFVKVLRSMQ